MGMLFTKQRKAAYTTNMAGDYQSRSTSGWVYYFIASIYRKRLSITFTEISISGYNFCENNNSITLDAEMATTPTRINADTEAY